MLWMAGKTFTHWPWEKYGHLQEDGSSGWKHVQSHDTNKHPHIN